MGDEVKPSGEEAKTAGVQAPAWDLLQAVSGEKPLPGILSAASGRLRFQSDHTDASFDVPFAELEGLRFAQMGMLLKVTVNGRDRLFCFNRPEGADAPALPAPRLLEGREAAKAFSAVLPF